MPELISDVFYVWLIALIMSVYFVECVDDSDMWNWFKPIFALSVVTVYLYILQRSGLL